LLVAVVLSAQSTDVAVNKATEALFAKVDTPEAMVQLGEINLKSYIKTIGLYHAKARHIIGLSEQLIARHQSQVPNSLADLMALPGVGIKTAKVVLSCAFGVPTIAVDTHVHRVSNRLGLVCTDTPAQTQKIIDEAVPAAYLQDAHHLLILHGRYCCKARKPDCAQCCLAELCQSKMLKWSEIVPDA
jgi:endonuclease-3